MAVNVTLQRRRVPRRSFDNPAGILKSGKYQMNRAYQLGEGGMMIGANEPMQVGTLLVVSFYVQTSTLILVRAIVRSVIPAEAGLPERYGLEFLNLGFQLKRAIRNFVAAATRSDGAVKGD